MHLGRVPIYSNKKDKILLQEKIDWLYGQNVVDKAYKYGPVRYTSPVMLVRKASAKNKPSDQLTHKNFRFVNLHNKLNDYIEPQPSKSINMDEAIYEVGQWKYILETDLTDSFYQRWVAENKIPFMGFHSPFGGVYVMLRSSNGMKGQSEGLDEMGAQVLGDIEKEGKCYKFHDDLKVGGNTVKEALDNWDLVTSRLAKNNLKLNPAKTKLFVTSTELFGWDKN